MKSVRPHRTLLPLIAVTALVAACGGGEGAAGDGGAGGGSTPPPGAGGGAPAGAEGRPPAPEVVLGQPAGAPAPAAAEASQLLPSDRIPEVVARVDGRDLTRGDLLARAAVARGALSERGIDARPTADFYRKVLDDLIGNRLVYRELEAEGRAASAEEIEAQLATIRSRFDSDQALDQALAERGLDRERLRREIAESITVSRWVEQTIAPGVEVTDDEVRAFYEANREQMVEPEKVHARHVLVSIGAGAGAEQKRAARKKVDELRAKLAAGADFAAVARESSDDKGSGARGGDLGWFYRGQMVPSFDQAAFALEPGELSQVVESPFGFHLIEVQERQAQKQVELDQVREELRQRLRRHELEQAVRARLDELGSAVEIEIFLPR